MKIAGFILVKKDGERYCANMLTVGTRNHPALHGQQSVVMFVCSGTPMIVAAEDIDRIEFTPDGWQHCNHCDSSLYNVIGAGIAANNHQKG